MTNVLWYIFNLFSKIPFQEYQILNKNGDVVSYARVIGKIKKFPFMEKDGIHIGPCFTMKSERGRGFYPYLINRIMGDNQDKTDFMIVNQNNESSIRGIQKAGFLPFAKGHSTFFRRYVIDEYIQ